MKRNWRILTAIILLSISGPGIARAESIQPALGNAWLNTPVAWNEDPGWYVAGGAPEVSRNMGTSFKIAGAYARGKGEVNVGYLSFDDPSNTRVSGFSLRYTISAPESTVDITLLGGAQSTTADGSGSDSTGVFGFLAGQRFTKGGGISLGFFYWGDVGSTLAGKEIGEDIEFTANIGVAFSPTWKGFVEGWTFGDAERAGYAFGATAELAENISMLIAHSFVTQPKDDQVTELYFTYRFRD
ncbi:MAG: hypothetical protein V2G42_09340 [bacterium JZ-2024 1]